MLCANVFWLGFFQEARNIPSRGLWMGAYCVPDTHLASLIKGWGGEKSWLSGYQHQRLLFLTIGQKSVKDKARNNLGIMHYKQGSITIHIGHHHCRYKRRYISAFYLTMLSLACFPFSLFWQTGIEKKSSVARRKINWLDQRITNLNSSTIGGMTESNLHSYKVQIVKWLVVMKGDKLWSYSVFNAVFSAESPPEFSCAYTQVKGEQILAV